MNNEAGHFPNAFYADQKQNLHLNGSTFYFDETGGGNTFTNTAMTFPGNLTVLGTTTLNSNLSVNTPVVAIGSIANSVDANGATLANGTALTTAVVFLNNVASGNNAVVLPTPAVAGQRVIIINTNAAANAAIFPTTNGTINGGSANASVNLVSLTGTTFIARVTSPASWWSY